MFWIICQSTTVFSVTDFSTADTQPVYIVCYTAIFSIIYREYSRAVHAWSLISYGSYIVIYWDETAPLSADTTRHCTSSECRTIYIPVLGIAGVLQHARQYIWRACCRRRLQRLTDCPPWRHTMRRTIYWRTIRPVSSLHATHTPSCI